MLRRALALLLCVLGAVAIGLGIASATAWRSADTLAATAAGGDARLIVTDPGVLDLAADDVTVRAESEGGTVLVALARSSEVDAWVGDERVTRVTGLLDTTTLTTRTTGTVPETPGDPRGADLWVEEWTGEGEVTVPLSADSGRWSLLVAAVGDDAAPPVLTLTWPQEVRTPWLVPLVAGGSVLLLAGLALLAWTVWNDRSTARRAASRASRSGPAGTQVPGSTSADSPSAPTPADGEDRPLTRRELREREQRRERERGPDSLPGAAPLTPATPATSAPVGTAATTPVASPAATGTTADRTAADRTAALERLRGLARRRTTPAGDAGDTPESGARTSPDGLRGTGLPGAPAPGSLPTPPGAPSAPVTTAPSPGLPTPPPGGPAVPPPPAVPPAGGPAGPARPATTSSSGEAWRRTWGIPPEARTWVPEAGDDPAPRPAPERRDTDDNPTGEGAAR